MADAEDRLSELSNEVIHLIFSKLQTRDVVRTTILSKRWVNLWTTVTSLDFEILDSQSQRNFINRVLERSIATKIKFFRVKIKNYVGKSLDDDMLMWINFAIDRNVVDLHILNDDMKSTNPNVPYFTPPQSLHSYLSVRKIYIEGCDIESSSNVRWNRLESLVVLRGYVNADVMNRILSGSPQLKIPCLLQQARPDKMNIRSSSLKFLKIVSWDHSGRDPFDELTIWAPKLEIFEVHGPVYSKCLLMDTFSLSLVELDFWEVEVEGGRSLLEETLREIFPAIQYAKVVKLSSDCTQVLSVVEGNRPSFSNATLLCVAFRPIDDEWEEIVGILEAFPKLESLVIRKSSSHYNYGLIFEDLQDVGEHSKNLESLSPHLTIIDISSRCFDESLSSLIVSLLQRATEVRQIEIRNIGDRENGSKCREMVEMVDKLFPSLQSSPKSKLVFYQNCTL